ncbi:hypothetical protein HPB50_013496 [Hyalomma asiaticum]|uniref:Uncharacterized protein n=1 Tax=Hyalomma asiaticum TaxID=266040 RepID=A0ACB7S8Q4_HYAAI|nr:hypothetical protein HPB50_013496 [Hyalomma asiaticum]
MRPISSHCRSSAVACQRKASSNGGWSQNQCIKIRKGSKESRGLPVARKHTTDTPSCATSSHCSRQKSRGRKM